MVDINLCKEDVVPTARHGVKARSWWSLQTHRQRALCTWSMPWCSEEAMGVDIVVVAQLGGHLKAAGQWHTHC